MLPLKKVQSNPASSSPADLPPAGKSGSLIGRKIQDITHREDRLSFPESEKVKSIVTELENHPPTAPTISPLFTPIQENALLEIPVLNQYEDDTGSGFENCGFHSLKNSLVALIPGMASKELNQLFMSKEVFKDFYTSYCIPILEENNLSKGHRNATLPILEAVIENFVNDPNPPESLALLQQGVRYGLENQSLAVLMTSVVGDAPVLGFISPQHAFDGLALHQLSKNPGPQTLSLVVGDAMVGHWYTVVVHKNSKNEYSFAGSNSMGSDTLALSKLVSLIKNKISNPDELLKEAYSPIDDIISRNANHFEPDNSITDEDAAALHANTILPDTCKEAYQFMEAAGWFSSDDYEIQKKVSALEILISFYHDGSKQELTQMLETIRKEKPADAVISAFDTASNDIATMRTNVTPFAYKQVEDTFKFMKLLYENRKQYAKIEDSTVRLDAMNKIAKGSGVEEGFVSGKSANESEKSTLMRVDTLLLTFQKAKQADRLDEFFKVVAEGDGCLTARMGRIADFYSKLLGVASYEDLLNMEKVNSAPMVSIEGFFGDCDYSKEEIEQFKKEEFHKDMNNFETLKNSFIKFSSVEASLPFRQYLQERGIIPSVTDVDWDAALPKIFAMPEFDGWLSQGKASALIWM